MKITVRQKENESGTASLFLDIRSNGKRKREFIGKTVYPNPTTPKQRTENQLALEFADRLRGKRLLEHDNNVLGVRDTSRLNEDFIEYFTNWRATYPKADFRKVDSAIEYLKRFVAVKRIAKLTSSNITKTFCEQFAEYMKSELSEETVRGYFNKFKKCLEAANDEKVVELTRTQIKTKFKKDDSVKKALLTSGEIQLLSKARWGNDVVRRAYFFSLNTGTDFATTKALTWNLVDGDWIDFERTKVDSNKKVSLNKNAKAMMGKPGKPDEQIFPLPTWYGCMKSIRLAAKSVGITKKLTWHSARHSFGTNMINDQKQDVRIVQQLMGHKDIRQTVRYTQVRPKTMQDAVNLIPDLPE